MIIPKKTEQNVPRYPHHQLGISIIEIIIAMALFAIIASVGLVSILGSFTTNRLGDEHSQATALAQAGIEAARSIRNQGWSSDFLATSCSSGCGLSNSGGSWEWSGSNNVVGPFTRTVTIEDVQRNGSGTIVTSGGTNDPDTKKVVSSVSWDFSPTRNNTVELATYLTYFRQLIVGDWTVPSLAGSYDATGNDDMVKVEILGSHAYMVRNAGAPRFLAVSIATPATPTLTGSLALATNNPINLFLSGTIAYLAGTQTTNEVNTINIATPATPTLVGNYDTAGTADANGVYVVGTTAYVVNATSGSPELYILNVTNPASISLLGSLNLTGTPREIVVNGSYAYIVNIDNAQELQVVNITNPAAPSLAATLNLPSNDDAVTISFANNYLYIGQGANLRIVSVATPTAPSLVSSLALGGLINDIALNLADSNQFLFTATSNATAEFRVVNVSNPASPTIAASIDITGNNPLRGVAYDQTLDRVVAVGNSNTQEVVVIVPN